MLITRMKTWDSRYSKLYDVKIRGYIPWQKNLEEIVELFE